MAKKITQKRTLGEPAREMRQPAKGGEWSRDIGGGEFCILYHAWTGVLMQPLLPTRREAIPEMKNSERWKKLFWLKALIGVIKLRHLPA